MKTLQIGADTFSIPDQWNELTPDQFVHVARLSQQPWPINTFKLKCLLLFLGFTMDRRACARIRSLNGVITEYFYLRVNRKKVHMVTAADMAFMLLALDWLLTPVFSDTETVPEPAEGADEPEIIGYQVQCKLVKNLLPKIKIGQQVFYGPEDGLTNCIYKEFIHCEDLFSRYAQSHEDKYLDKFIAVLYRLQRDDYLPESVKYSGDRREVFNDAITDSRAKIIAKARPEIKQAIALWYHGCKLFLAFEYPHVFERSEVADRIQSDRVPVFKQQLKIVDALAKHDVTKTEEILNTKLHIVMNTLESMRLEQIELEKLYKK